jgi:outer membrane protein assembly factor BamD
MFKTPFLLFLSVLTLIIGLNSCTEYSKVLKSTDAELKWEYAQAALDSGYCVKALPLLEELVGLTRGTQRAQQVQYKYAQTHYCVNDFYLARYYFTNYAKTFPNSDLVEEVEFKAAICSYNLSPNWSLDQTETRSAIQELQLFMDRYPASALRDSSQTMVDNLRSKLERKSFESAAIYHKTGQFKSATIAMKNALKDFPDSPFRVDLQFLILDSYYQYAVQSTNRRKLERFNDAALAFHTFASRFPDSSYLPEAQRIYEHCVKAVETLESEEN